MDTYGYYVQLEAQTEQYTDPDYMLRYLGEPKNQLTLARIKHDQAMIDRLNQLDYHPARIHLKLELQLLEKNLLEYLA